ncbi:hypothetical protein ACFV3R_16645 [Streptomyces sp. NPDC059740]|uniref:hypothetical protein n=1 Tax=Streptomyces sp. NPDC059740 TaxID=3346926 RepID=UPI0036686C8A
MGRSDHRPPHLAPTQPPPLSLPHPRTRWSRPGARAAPDHASRVRELAAAPAPAPGGPPAGGPAQVIVLRDGAELLDADEAEVAAAAEDLAAECDALVAALSREWGRALPVDLRGHLERVARGEPVPAPLDVLSGEVALLHVWRTRPARWVGVGTAEARPGVPPRLLACAGAGDRPTGAAGR